MMRRLHYLFLFVLLSQMLSSPLSAQDPRFSQFYKAPMLLNPALSGVFNGQGRVHINYRSLYASVLAESAFETYMVGTDWKFNMPNRRDAASFNFLALRDESGQNGFSRTYASLGGAYLKNLSQGGYQQASHYLSAGAQVGFGQYQINSRDLWFSNQYDGQNLEIDFDRASGEPIGAFSGDFFLDINAGLLYYAIWNDRNYIYAGGTVHHANQPDISFFDDSPPEALYLRWSGHAGGEASFTNNLSILPAALFTQQGPSTSLTLGLNFRYSNWNPWELNLRAGPWAHFSNRLDQGMQLEAMVAAVIFELERINFGVSYDLTTSTLGQSNYARGAIELSATYFLKPRGYKTKVECPEL